MVAHAFNPSTREAETGEFLSSRPAWSTSEFQNSQGYTEKPCLEKKTKQNKQTNKKQNKKNNNKILRKSNCYFCYFLLFLLLEVELCLCAYLLLGLLKDYFLAFSRV